MECMRRCGCVLVSFLYHKQRIILLREEDGVNQDLPCLVIVIPCYNEEAVLPLTAPLFAAKLDELVAAYGLSEKKQDSFRR